LSTSVMCTVKIMTRRSEPWNCTHADGPHCEVGQKRSSSGKSDHCYHFNGLNAFLMYLKK
jgi:hypothetical protein